MNSLWLARRAEHREVFCKSRIVSNNDEFLDYVALHPATVLLKLNATANFMGAKPYKRRSLDATK